MINKKIHCFKVECGVWNTYILFDQPTISKTSINVSTFHWRMATLDMLAHQQTSKMSN